MKEKIINLEYKSFITKIIIILWFIVSILFLYKISNVIIILILSLFLSILFSPLLNKLNKWKINDLIWIIIIFLLLCFVIALIVFLIIPLIVNQSIILLTLITDYTSSLLEIYNKSWIEWFWLPLIVQNFIKNLNVEQILVLIQQNSSEISIFLWTNIKNIITGWAWIIFSVTSSLLNFILVFLFTFFITLERKKIRNLFYAILPEKISVYIYNNEKKVTNILSVWLKWQLLLGVSMFLLTSTWLLILKILWLNINWIFTLALISFFMEFIPYIWTFVSFFLALSISIWSWIDAFIWVLILYLIIQQIEWNFLVPYIMARTLSLSPFIVLLSMITWWVLFWIIWVLFTMPFISIIDVFLRPYIDKRKKENYFIK